MYGNIIDGDGDNVDVKFNQKVTSIGKSDANYYNIKTDNNDNVYYGDNIILSIPPRNLADLTEDSEILKTERFENMLDSIINRVAAKLNLIYDISLWSNNMTINEMLLNKLMNELSASITTQEIREIYIDNVWNNDSLITIHIYTRIERTSYWYDLQQLNLNEYLYGIHPDLSILDDINITNIMANQFVVNEAIKQLNILFQSVFVENLSLFLEQSPFETPLAAFIAFWGKGNEASGASRWRAGYNIDEIMIDVNNPIKNENIFIVNCDYSLEQTWMEHAFINALNNLQINFEIDDPFKDAPRCEPTND